MLTAFVMVTCERVALAEVGPALAAAPGVAEVYTTAGEVDYIAILRVKDMEALAAVVTDNLRHIPGISRTQTHVALRAYSEGDLEAAFQIGLD
ncbi:MAG: Lrp/AsnC family transcriptional regulator [Candidatus Dormibacteria bacterium]